MLAYELIYPYTVELYPTKYRVIGTSVAMAFGKISGMVMPFIVLNFFFKNPYLIFYVFGVSSFFGFLAVLIIPVDTTGREID